MLDMLHQFDKVKMQDVGKLSTFSPYTFLNLFCTPLFFRAPGIRKLFAGKFAYEQSPYFSYLELNNCYYKPYRKAINIGVFFACN